MSVALSDSLSDSSLLIIFTYAPAGLGHLRVTDALYHGLPKGVKPLILGSHDTTITFLHRLTSIHQIGRSVQEFFQQGVPERLFVTLYRNYLRTHTDYIYEQLRTLIEQHINLPKTVLIIATHFALGHQIGEIKDKLAKEKGIRIVLVVQVTDDSPQAVWYIPNADLIFVPSRYTKKELHAYAHSARLPLVPIEVLPYPISLALGAAPADWFGKRLAALKPESNEVVHMAIPISGAAVGMNYSSTLIEKLHMQSNRFIFHVIAKIAPFTRSFLSSMKGKPDVHLDIFSADRQVVDDYGQLYLDHPIVMEITKPSEQAFKALYSFDQLGGSILLFTRPVGRQEQDNLNFLIHHELIPDEEENALLVSELQKEESQMDQKKVMAIVRGYRGFSLPTDPYKSYQCIIKALTMGLFYEMLMCAKRNLPKAPKDIELGTNGVEKFWEKISLVIPN